MNATKSKRKWFDTNHFPPNVVTVTAFLTGWWGWSPPMKTSSAFLSLCLFFPTPPHTLCHCWCWTVSAVCSGDWHPWSTASCYSMPLARVMGKHLRDIRGPLAGTATRRTMRDAGKAGCCLQPELQIRIGKGGQVRYSARFPCTCRGGSYLGAGCQIASWGLGVAGSHKRSKKKCLLRSTQSQGTAPSISLLCYLFPLVCKSSDKTFMQVRQP